MSTPSSISQPMADVQAQAEDSVHFAPSALADDADCEHDLRVRFCDECVLISDQHRSRVPRLLQKSYSLPPLFRRRESSSPSPIDDAANQDVIPNVSKLSLVHMWTKKSAMRRRASSVERSPLAPCLVHHDPTTPERAPRARRPSLPLAIPHSPLPHVHVHTGVEVATIPLRPCCSDCFHVTDACLSSGDAWRERFTRAARSRRHQSLDYQMLCAAKNGGLVIPASPPQPSTFSAVAVDEVAQGKTLPSPKLDVDDNSAPDGPAADTLSVTVKPVETDHLLPIPDDITLGSMLSRRVLSPIPSRNASSEDLSAADSTTPETEDDSLEDGNLTLTHASLLTASPSSESPPSSPPLRTPSPPPHTITVSPKTRFRMPAGADIIRVGVDVLKGVGSLAASPTL